MKIENQVVSLELSRKLKELGIKQESFFWWEGHGDSNIIYLINPFPSSDSKNEIYSAFTVAELMDMLPATIDTGKDEPFNYYWLTIQKRNPLNIKYIAAYYCDTTYSIMTGFTKLFSCHDEQFADCLAKTLIKCIENGWIKNE